MAALSMREPATPLSLEESGGDRIAARVLAMQHIDVRGLPPPEPFLNISLALQKLGTDTLRVLIHREPYPLYDMLGEAGFVWHTTAQANGDFEILIARKP